jgi:hypothetical protein
VPRLSIHTTGEGPDAPETVLSPGLLHAAKRRPIDAYDPASIALRIEPIHDRVDENPFVPLVLE